MHELKDSGKWPGHMSSTLKEERRCNRKNAVVEACRADIWKKIMKYDLLVVNRDHYDIIRLKNQKDKKNWSINVSTITLPVLTF